MITIQVTARQLHMFLVVTGHAFATGEALAIDEDDSESRRMIYLADAQAFTMHATSQKTAAM